MKLLVKHKHTSESRELKISEHLLKTVNILGTLQLATDKKSTTFVNKSWRMIINKTIHNVFETGFSCNLPVNFMKRICSALVSQENLCCVCSNIVTKAMVSMFCRKCKWSSLLSYALLLAGKQIGMPRKKKVLDQHFTGKYRHYRAKESGSGSNQIKSIFIDFFNTMLYNL